MPDNALVPRDPADPGKVTDDSSHTYAYEMDLKRPDTAARRLVIKAQKLEYGDPDVPRLLVTIADVSPTRA